MAAPNIVGVATIIGITTYLSLSTTSAKTLVSNASASGKVLKINCIIVSNKNQTGVSSITVKYHDTAAGAGTSYSLATTVGLAPKSTLVVTDKASAIYIEENRSMSVTSSTTNDLDILCSYESVQ